MNNTFKGLLLIFTFICASTFNVMADKEEPINANQLPATAQKVLKANFSDSKIAIAKKETDLFSKSYDVVFTNGNKIEFDRNGHWEKISCKQGEVPSVLIPSSILQYVNNHFQQVLIVEIEKDNRGYEVELSNGIELEFNQKGRCTKVD